MNAEKENAIAEDDSKEVQLPNIVVIMNEAFSDLRVLGEFETTKPVMEYYDSLQQNCLKGWTNVSVIGGNTANSEYEFLSSDSLGVYGGMIPYNSFFSTQDVYPGLDLI